MITGITKDIHWIGDVTYVPAVWAAPKLLGFENNKKATSTVRAFSAAVLGYSLLTDAKWGLVKLIPYKAHAALDLASGIAAFAAPAVLKMTDNKKVRNTFWTMGIIGLTVGILSLIGAKKSA